ncbi:cyclase family protein [Methanosarcina horonobensis]|uniref:cyclase family protein n=1 Tax=Methanosarcina horonobensis TaxID=418008 RepID=UPI000AF8D6EC|nr:cyclase family protein [Methanosarcina horonobensis]
MFAPKKKHHLRKKIIDITVPISPSTPIFPGDPEPSVENICTLEKDGFAVSKLVFGSHTGTHVDAPSHVLKDGPTVDNLNIESLMGQAVVLDFSRINGVLTDSILNKAYNGQKISESVSILLVKTQKSSFRKEKKF